MIESERPAGMFIVLATLALYYSALRLHCKDAAIVCRRKKDIYMMKVTAFIDVFEEGDKDINQYINTSVQIYNL